MFTGIIEQTATLIDIAKTRTGSKLTIACEGWSRKVDLGESICVSGCCLTVMQCSGDFGKLNISFDIIPETLQRTTLGMLEVGDSINIERSLTTNSLLGGHFVQGHVDGIETIMGRSGNNTVESRMKISMESIDPDTIVSKGSVTIEGVSLTIAAVENTLFEVALIPTTETTTTLGNLAEGKKVNVETDILARTIAHVVRRMK